MGHFAKVLTVSDGVVAGTREDKSGEGLRNRLGELGYQVVESRVTKDGIAPVASSLLEMSDGFHGLILTTGGTGFSERDLTPEGTSMILERFAPGLSEAARSINPLGRLSRGVSGTRGASLIINLPGSTTGALECLSALEDVLEHAISLLLDNSSRHPNG
ncbi:MAG: MogA/MoaB family molybdenum cofactor biosynthesis protein [Acidimicrobiaceae bacterium]|nr:MogA/MoaB family molybdenum cofactor biosynthesis protein [Acidimicrobiaceae bacterium]